jgi:hypothetical protein
VTSFAQVQQVKLDNYASMAAAKIAGIQVAQTSIVAFAEDHVFHAPDWCEKLVQAHAEGDIAAAAARVVNANPGSLLSWSDFVLGYAPWAEPVTRGDCDLLPGNNGSYKRDILLAYGDMLETLLEAETVLYWDLRSKGYRLWLETETTFAHTNYSRWRPCLQATFIAGRTFAAGRAARWPMARRLLYGLSWALIPWVRLIRCWQNAAATPVFPHLLPVLMLQFYVSAAGELVGYWFGVNARTLRSRGTLEINRKAHIREADRDLNNLETLGLH